MAAILRVADQLRPVSRKEVRTTIDLNKALQKQGAGYQTIDNEVRKDVTFSSTTQYAHGPSGYLNQPGADPNVISTIYRTQGISRFIPFHPSRNVNPVFKMLTSQGADVGTEATDPCVRGKQPAKLTEANFTAPFGLLKRSTETMSVDRIGQIINRGEPMDLRMVNDPKQVSPFVPAAAQNFELNGELRTQYYRLGISVERQMETDAFVGAGQNQGTNSGYRQFYGLDWLINTGKTDMVTGTLIPAADSTILNWSSQLASGSNSIQGQSMDIITAMSSLMKFMEAKARSTGMLPVSWRWAMRWDLFWELTALWPCSYLTNHCTTTNLNGATQFVSGSENVAMRDSMRSGQFLWVNGIQMPVDIIDTDVEGTAAGGAKSDIYLIPYNAAGMSTLYWEYFDYNNPALADFIGNMMPSGEFTVTDGGKFIWTYDRTSYCAYFEIMMQMRLVLRTAFLAARITNVAYPSALHVYDSNPNGIYFQPAGGSTVGSFNPAALYGVYSI